TARRAPIRVLPGPFIGAAPFRCIAVGRRGRCSSPSSKTKFAIPLAVVREASIRSIRYGYGYGTVHIGNVWVRRYGTVRGVYKTPVRPYPYPVRYPSWLNDRPPVVVVPDQTLALEGQSEIVKVCFALDAEAGFAGSLIPLVGGEARSCR